MAGLINAPGGGVGACSLPIARELRGRGGGGGLTTTACGGVVGDLMISGGSSSVDSSGGGGGSGTLGGGRVLAKCALYSDTASSTERPGFLFFLMIFFLTMSFFLASFLSFFFCFLGSRMRFDLVLTLTISFLMFSC